MSAEIVTIEDLEKFRTRLLADLVQMMRKPAPTEPLVTSGQVRKILNISPGTLQRLRIKGLLPYVRLDGAFRYRKVDVESIIMTGMTKKQ